MNSKYLKIDEGNRIADKENGTYEFKFNSVSGKEDEKTIYRKLTGVLELNNLESKNGIIECKSEEVKDWRESFKNKFNNIMDNLEIKIVKSFENKNNY